MKHLKEALMSLFVAAILAAAAYPAPASAEATLCSTNTNPCSGTKYLSGTKFAATLKTGTHTTLSSSIGSITCKKSSLSMATTDNRAHGETSAATYTECTLGSSPCTVTAINLPWTSEWDNPLFGNAAWVNTPTSGSGNPTINVVCNAFVNCSFSASQIKYNVTGGNPAVATLKEQEFKGSGGGLCPTSGKQTGEWEITTPKPLFIEP